MLEHARLNFELKGEHGLVELRKHLAKYITGWHGARHFRAQAVQVKTLNDVDQLVQDIEARREVAAKQKTDYR